jgi:hypothetical protein
VKTKRTSQTKRAEPPLALREATASGLATEPDASPEPMVRTQVYLTKAEHEVLLAEAGRLGQPMAAVLRSLIDAKMAIPEDAWSRNPMLEASPEDPAWVGHEDGALNHDHYIYGSPKRYVQVNGQWASAPPSPEAPDDVPPIVSRRAKGPRRTPSR